MRAPAHPASAHRQSGISGMTILVQFVKGDAFGFEALTSETNHENPNLARSSKCSSRRMAARPGSIFHLPASSYKHTSNAQFVTMATTPRFCHRQSCLVSLL